MMITKKVVLIFTSIVVLGFSHTSTAQDWATFQNTGNLASEKWNLPTQWSPDTEFDWIVDVEGYGQSSPVVFGSKVFLTSVVGPNKEDVQVTAFDLDSGNQHWSFKEKNNTPEKNTVMVSRAAPSPVADSEGIYAFFEGGNLVALDHTGQKKWDLGLAKKFGPLKARHGLAASLEQDRDRIYLWAERTESPFVLAINKKDGSIIWNSEGLGATSWASPRLIPVDGEMQLVLSAIGIITGLAPETGEKLWELKTISGNSSSTPIPIGNNQFLTGAGSPRPGQKSLPSCGVVKVTKNEDSFSADWLWNSASASCSFGSPVAANGRAYFVNRSGVVHCHDLESGEPVFTGRLPCSQIWATPLAAGNRIYFFGKDGATSIIEAGDKLKVMQTSKLWTPESKSEETSSNPASRFSGAVLYAAIATESKLIFRRGDRLYCLSAR